MASFRTFQVLGFVAGLLFVSSGISKAAIFLTVNGQHVSAVVLRQGDWCNIEIVSTDNSVYGAIVGFQAAYPLGSFQHIGTRPEAGKDASVEPFNEPPFSCAYLVTAIDFSMPPNVQPGVHFVFGYHAEAPGQVMLGLWDWDFNLVDEVMIIMWPPYGACCNKMTGNCYESEEWECEYTWLGPDTDCSMCPHHEFGACCNQGTGECYISEQWNCLYTWLGPGSDCSMCEAPLTVTSPNGGECLLANTPYTITWWPGVGSIMAVLIEYSTDNGQNWNAITTVPNSGSYNWVVPVVDSSQCLVRISDATNPSVSDTSNAVFSIELSRYSGGTGISNDPYRIATAEDLNDIGNHEQDWDKHFILVNDVNLAQYTGTQFKIIGNNTTKFTGIFDGKERKVWNFTWTSTGRNHIGLFGYVGSGGQIKNLGIENVNVSDGNGNYIGGLVGHNDGTISICYASGSVLGSGTVGGLVGINNVGTIVKCYSTGTVSGGGWVGGIVGTNFGTTSTSYSTGFVSGGQYVGGLVGYNGGGTIKDCYSTGSVSGTSSVGGLVGYKPGGSVTTSFWDTQTSGQLTSDGGTPKTTTEMKTKSTFTDAGWDFVNIWDICEGTNYPRLRWQISSAISMGDFVCPYGNDFMDFAVIASAWLSKPDDPDWNAACDISKPKDSVIDELDLSVFCENWLEGM
jgi:hypothetical protein